MLMQLTWDEAVEYPSIYELQNKGNNYVDNLNG